MRFYFFLFSVFLGFASGSHALSLDEFILKVTNQNSNIQSQKLDEEALLLRANEGYLITSPNYFLSGTYASDKKQSQNPTFEGEQRLGSEIQTGLEQQSSLGVNHKLYFSTSSQKLEGADPTFLPNSTVSTSSFNYEFTLPIWRNGFGRSTRDQVGIIVEQNKSDGFAARFRQKQERASAISTYWRLKSAQELYSLSKEMLSSNQNFLKWTKNRVRDRLSESIDLKQAEAAVALREFELNQSESELLEAKQAFNEMLEEATETPVPHLDPLPEAEKWPVRTISRGTLTREDISSLESLLNAQNAQSRIASEGTKPQLDFMGHVSSNGLDQSSREAFDKSLTSKNPYFSVGLKLSIPLDRSSVNDVQKSAHVRASSTASQLKRKRYEVKAEIEKLERNFAHAMKVYISAKAVEKAQLEKFEIESARRRSGRTTTFQLLSFQQEYQASKQARIRALNLLLQLNAQFTLFTDGSSL